MTSSLVGSEMCIRDRVHIAVSQEDTIGDLRLPCACGHSTRKKRAANAAVSYTHLTLPTICSV
eukprot:2220587-Prorocentrum_lima.AAC.1